MIARSKRERIGRYILYEPISSGGMASVHFGRLLGPIGFKRTVAIKRMHVQFANDPDFVAMFLDEARLAARIHHPNAVGTLDVVDEQGELFLVMEYVGGLPLSLLLRASVERGIRLPPAHASAILIGALHGLHAAHEATSSEGRPLSLVHRDVSPQNILLAEDGIPRVIDFGIARATERVHATRDDVVRGKVRYMAPEQLTREDPDRRADIYAASVVLWEMLVYRDYIDIDGLSPVAKVAAMLDRRPERPSMLDRSLPRAIDDVVLRGLERQREDRFATAADMAAALEAALPPSTQRELGEWVRLVAGDTLRDRAALLRAIETEPDEPSSEPAVRSSGRLRSIESSSYDEGAKGGTASISLSLSVPESRAPTPARATRMDLRPLAVTAVLASLFLAGAVGWSRRTKPPSPTDGTAVVPPPVVEPAEFPPPPVPLPPPSASAIELVEPPPVASVRPPRVRPVVRPDPCKPPYTVDAMGVKSAKVGCKW